ncbi:nucleoside transporter family protein, putative [Ichthyophthirius multifiliis]|uniref:Nucleoside transporter family protein, putative n=1 Tax=Ichthyophthirius multifiliis TaxID=5932 RepID=G0QYE9_ICHMU|nr:nucleoside transporter family protein, putative [Ichthyophthirius multifiliis]EGR29758.1 nucleoside transporter family protein, putative [Ichthyophthirius multifiliis]|eukprot:XP_004030994.1 nucleoside transporter family protein, putative [Ichthyophthirius multifiliis]
MTELVNIQTSQNHLPKQPQEEEDYEKLPPITLFHKITFALLGICSLTGWNSILNAFDFFQDKFPKHDYVDVAFYFPIPIMCSNFLVGITLTLIGNNIPFEKRIPFALRGAVLTIIFICLIGIYLKQTQAGIALVFIVLIFQGIFDSLMINSAVALSGATQSGVLISIFWNFTALSGIIMNVLRFIAFGAFGLQDLDNGTCLYFAVATLFYLVGSILGPAPFFIFTNYVQTFMLFPGVSVFQKPSYTLIQNPFVLVFMCTIYNLGDLTVARNQGSQAMQNDLFQFFFLYIFASMDGLITSILMTVAPQRATNSKDRNFISYVNMFSLTFGISVGSFMALILVDE